MNKEIYIRDYSDKKVPITIPNFEDVIKIIVEIISGDEVLTVLYRDYSTKKFDSSGCRMQNFYDDEYELPLDKIDEFSDFVGTSYDCDDMFR